MHKVGKLRTYKQAIDTMTPIFAIRISLLLPNLISGPAAKVPIVNPAILKELRIVLANYVCSSVQFN